VRRTTAASVVLASALVVAAAAFHLVRGGMPGLASASPDAAVLGTVGPGAVRSAGELFLSHYEQPDGEVMRWDQGSDTVSEGQAYAMLISVALGERSRFAAAWRWSRAHLVEPDGLLAWRYAYARVVDRSAAADADVDTAWALELAARRFGDGSYRSAAAHLARAVLAHEVQAVAGEEVLLPGPWAAGPAPIINPSYLVTSDMAALDFASTRWSAVQKTSDRLLGELMGGGHLPPDWAVVAPGGSAHPTSPPGQGGAPVTYGFDAVRLPIRLAASCQADQVRLAAGLWPALERGVRAGDTLVNLDLGGSAQVGGSTAPIGLVGGAGAAAAAGHLSVAQRLLATAQRRNDAHPTYYGSAWVALGRILLQTRALGTCPP